MAGILLGGFISGPLFARDQRWALWMAAAAYIAAFPVLLLAIFTSSYAVAMGCLFFGFAILTCAYGPLYALVQNVLRPDLRAFPISLTFLATNLSCAGLGPLLNGFATAVAAAERASNPRALGASFGLALFPFS